MGRIGHITVRVAVVALASVIVVGCGLPLTMSRVKEISEGTGTWLRQIQPTVGARIHAGGLVTFHDDPIVAGTVEYPNGTKRGMAARLAGRPEDGWQQVYQVTNLNGEELQMGVNGTFVDGEAVILVGACWDPTSSYTDSFVLVIDPSDGSVRNSARIPVSRYDDAAVEYLENGDGNALLIGDSAAGSTTMPYVLRLPGPFDGDYRPTEGYTYDDEYLTFVCDAVKSESGDLYLISGGLLKLDVGLNPQWHLPPMSGDVYAAFCALTSVGDSIMAVGGAVYLSDPPVFNGLTCVVEPDGSISAQRQYRHVFPVGLTRIPDSDSFVLTGAYRDPIGEWAGVIGPDGALADPQYWFLTGYDQTNRQYATEITLGDEELGMGMTRRFGLDVAGDGAVHVASSSVYNEEYAVNDFHAARLTDAGALHQLFQELDPDAGDSPLSGTFTPEPADDPDVPLQVTTGTVTATELVHLKAQTFPITVDTPDASAIDLYEWSGTSGIWALLACGDAGVVAIDVTDPLNPGTAVTHTVARANDVEAAYGHAYVAAESNGLGVLNMSDPAVPQGATYEATVGNAEAVVIYGDYAYVADSTEGLAIFDITTRGDPLSPSYYTMGAGATFVDVFRPYGEVWHAESVHAITGGNGASSLVRVNVTDTDAGSPSWIESLSLSGQPRDLSIDHDYFAHALIEDSAGVSIVSIDAQDIYALTQVGYFPSVPAGGILADGYTLYAFGDVIQIFDTTDRADPVVVAELVPHGDLNATGMVVDWPLAYLSSSSYGGHTYSGLVMTPIAAATCLGENIVMLEYPDISVFPIYP